MMSASGLLVMLACFNSGFGFREEAINSCSRIDFEEKMLEKMVILDHKVQTMLSGVNAKLEEMTSKYNAMVEQTDGKLQQIQTDVLNTTQELQDKVLQKPVAFIARFARDSQPIEGQALVFDTVVLNVGDGYNISDGTFTAPIPGAYIFSVQVCLHTGNAIKFLIVSMSTVYSATYFGESDYDVGCTSVSTVAVLEAGEAVWVLCKNTSASGRDLETSAKSHWSMFTGTLVHSA